MNSISKDYNINHTPNFTSKFNRKNYNKTQTINFQNDSFIKRNRKKIAVGSLIIGAISFVAFIKSEKLKNKCIEFINNLFSNKKNKAPKPNIIPIKKPNKAIAPKATIKNKAQKVTPSKIIENEPPKKITPKAVENEPKNATIPTVIEDKPQKTTDKSAKCILLYKKQEPVPVFIPKNTQNLAELEADKIKAFRTMPFDKIREFSGQNSSTEALFEGISTKSLAKEYNLYSADSIQKNILWRELNRRQYLELFKIDIQKPLKKYPRQEAVSSHHDINAYNFRIRQEVAKKNSLAKTYNERYGFSALSPLDSDCTCYRGRIECDWGANNDIEAINKAKIGDVFVLDTGFPYFANNIELAGNFAGIGKGYGDRSYIYKLSIPKGAKVSCNLEHGGEVILPCASKCKLLSKEVLEDKTNLINLEYVLPEA